MRNALICWAVVSCVGVLGVGCGDDEGEGSPAEGSSLPATAIPAEPPEQAARQLANALATAKTKRDCRDITRINRRSTYRFACPVPAIVRRSMRNFEVTDAEAYGTGAVVDYRSGQAPRGASIVLAASPNREWGVSFMGLVYGPTIPRSDDTSRRGFDVTVKRYLEAIRDRKCDAYIKYARTALTGRRAICSAEFPQLNSFSVELGVNRDAKPTYLGGNERIGFYGLRLRQPKRRYKTISVLRLSPREGNRYLVIDAANGPVS